MFEEAVRAAPTPFRPPTPKQIYTRRNRHEVERCHRHGLPGVDEKEPIESEDISGGLGGKDSEVVEV
ncbi:MAG: hypothetical protein H7Y12_09735 [Sphingobacteriaceae bacterium]|nr:hypothetical protein [Cytophagaceae bacterium]